MKLLAYFCFLFVVWPAFGANESGVASPIGAVKVSVIHPTSGFYVIEDGSIYIGASGQGQIDPQKLEEAKTNCESWPAKDFPGGNWGELTNGFQVSLRFDKQIYTDKEPVQSIVLVRNITNRNIVFYDSNEASLAAINYLVYDESGQFMAPKPKYIGQRISSGGMNVIRAERQLRYVDNLNEAYDLPRGNYLVQASIGPCYLVGANLKPPVQIILTNGGYTVNVATHPVNDADATKPVEVRSAKVPIQIK